MIQERSKRQLYPSEQAAIADMYRRQHDFSGPLGFATAAGEIPMGWPDPNRIIKPGTTLRIVLASSMGDCGLTDNLAAVHGYGVRLDWDDAALCNIRLVPQQ